MMSDKIPTIHPGETLREDFIEGFGITQHRLARTIGAPPRRINEIVHGQRGITADAAVRLARLSATVETGAAVTGSKAASLVAMASERPVSERTSAPCISKNAPELGFKV